MVKTQRPWTAVEDRILRELYARTPVDDIAQRLGRSIHQVRHRAKRLGIQTWRMWTAADRARLRKAWGKMRTRDLARVLGRTPGAVKQQAMKMGLDSERYYTPEEIALLRKLYPTHTAAQIAERIHGTAKAALAIFRMAATLGLRKWPHWEPEVLERVRALHAKGLNDAQIGERMGLTRDKVHHIRYARLKLPMNVEAVKQAGRRAVAKQLATLGIKSGGELRQWAYRKYARENGWPEDLRPRAVQILNLLAVRGPMSRPELVEALGLRWKAENCGRNNLASNDPEGSYLAHLRARGLVLYIRRSRKTGQRGLGRLHGLYMLTAKAVAILERKVRDAERLHGAQTG
jgi:hypothetical protein